MPPSLIPNTDFSTVEYFTGEMAYAIANPVFDGQTQYLGHHEQIKDDSLDPTGVLSRVAGITEPFRVTRVGTTGSVITWAAGTVRTVDGVVASVPSGQLNLPADSISYVFIGQNTSTNTVTVQFVSGTTDVQAFNRMPVFKTVLAAVTTVSSNISTITDLRASGTRHIQPPQSALRVYGGQSQADWVATQGQVISGVLICRDATIPAGITITVDKYAKFICSGNWVNNGTINQIRPNNGFNSPASFVRLQSLDAAASLGNGIGNLGGTYDASLSLSSTGGGGGGAYIITGETAPYAACMRTAGRGGATLIIEAYGTVTQNGTIDLSGGDALATTEFGGAPFLNAFSGNGGGTGGYLSVGSKTAIVFTPTGTTVVRGGAGSNAVWVQGTATQISDTPGGLGAGGGVIDLTATIITTTGHTFNLSGGVCGIPASSAGALTTLGTNTYRRVTANGQINQPGIGAGFGGIGGSVSFAVSGSNTIITYINGASGVVNFRTYSPVF